MIIQFNTDNNVKGSEKLEAKMEAILTDKLSRFSSNLSRIEIHLSDENADKEGQDDKRCLLEARIEGKQPIAVSDQANTHEQALNGAIEKLKAALDSILGRLKDHQ